MQVAPTWNMFKNECIEGWLDGMHGQTLVLLLFAASQYCTENNHITYNIIFTESHYLREKSFTAQNKTQPPTAQGIWQTQAYLQETEEPLWHTCHRHLTFRRKPTIDLYFMQYITCVIKVVEPSTKQVVQIWNYKFLVKDIIVIFDIFLFPMPVR